MRTSKYVLSELVSIYPYLQLKKKSCKEKLQGLSLRQSRDVIRWVREGSGNYSAKSAYDAQFLCRLPSPALSKVWSLKSEQKIKFYMWLLLQNRNWTSDRLAKRGWPHSPSCCFCDQEIETAAHLLLGCPFAKELWHKAVGDQPRAAEAALSSSSTKEWWRKVCGQPTKEMKKTVSSFAAYTAWHLWNERNRRVFQEKYCTTDGVLQLIRDDVSLTS